MLGIIKCYFLLFLVYQVQAQIIVTQQNVTINCAKIEQDQSILCFNRTESCLNDTAVQANCPYVCGFCDYPTSPKTSKTPTTTSTTPTPTTTTTSTTTTPNTQPSANNTTTSTPTTTTTTPTTTTTAPTTTTTTTTTTEQTTTATTPTTTTSTTTEPTTTTTVTTTTVDPITYAVTIEHLRDNIIRITIYMRGVRNESMLEEVQKAVTDSLLSFDIRVKRVVDTRIVPGYSKEDGKVKVTGLVWDLELETDGKVAVDKIKGGIKDFGSSLEDKLPEGSGPLYKRNDFTEPTTAPPPTVKPPEGFRWTNEHTITVVCVVVAFVIIIVIIIITVVVHKRRTTKMKLDIEERRKNYDMYPKTSTTQPDDDLAKYN